MSLEQFASRGLKAQRAVNEICDGHRPPLHDKVTLPASDVAGGPEDAGAGENEAAPPRSESALKSLNSMPFINRSAVRHFLLEHAQATRPHNKFRRVSEETLRDIHESVRQMLIARVHRTPSKGRTM